MHHIFAMQCSCVPVFLPQAVSQTASTTSFMPMRRSRMACQVRRACTTACLSATDSQSERWGSNDQLHADVQKQYAMPGQEGIHLGLASCHRQPVRQMGQQLHAGAQKQDAMLVRRGHAPRERMATRVSVLGRRAMVSALRRPPLKSSRADAGPTWGISVSATISCFTPANARDCTQHRCSLIQLGRETLIAPKRCTLPLFLGWGTMITQNTAA